MRYRNLQPNQNLESMRLLYYYGKYKKEREEARLADATNPRVTKAYK